MGADMNVVSKMRKQFKGDLTPLKITLIYVFVGSLWILFSDKMLGAMIHDPAALTRLQTFKGWLYVIATAWMLYILIHRNIASIRRSAEALRESEEKYRSLTNDVLDSSAVGVFILDSDFKVVWVNQSQERYFSLRRDEVIGKDKRQLIRERVKEIFEDPEGFARKVLATYDNNTYAENFECHVLPGDEREERWLEHWSQPIRSGLYAGGRIEHYYDITERKRIGDRIQHLQNVLEAIRDINQLIVHEKNRKKLLQGVSEILDQTRDYKFVWIGLVDEGTREVLPAAQAGFEEGYLESIEVSWDDSETGKGPTGTALKTRKPYVMRDIGRDPRYKPWREEALKRGYASSVAVPLVYQERVFGALNVYSTTPNSFDEEEVDILSGVGQDIAFALHNIEIGEEREKAEEEKKDLQSQLLQSQKLESVGMLTGGIAHDFNNILTTILGYSELALAKLPKTDPLREYLKIIWESGEKAAVLTRQLLAFSRKQVLEMKVVNLNTVIENTGKMLGRVIGEDVVLELNIQSPVRDIKADPGQIEQVLMNLAVNARDAMPCGGRLTIETADEELDEEYAGIHEGVTPGSYVVLSIKDTGEGMTREVQERLFEPFFTTKGIGKGTGLGLATVYGIVKQHNGHIWVYSEPGKGSIFKVYFPVTDEAAEAVFPAEIAAVPQGTETVLVVEDEASIRKLIVETLRPLGYNVLDASCGEEALQISDTTEGAIDLLLTDVIMPGMSGKELSAVVKEKRPGIKVLYMSGYTDESIAQRGILDPGITFIQKPLTPGKLAKKLREVLDM